MLTLASQPHVRYLSRFTFALPIPICVPQRQVNGTLVSVIVLEISILIPLFNEEEFIGTVLDRVLTAPLGAGFTREVIVVDDGSTDGSDKVVEEFVTRYPDVVRLFKHQKNLGKGAASILLAAQLYAHGEYCLIQDADLEYDPNEYRNLLKPLLEGDADAVYGSRFMIVAERRVMYFWHSVANGLLTGMCNLASNVNLTDMGTGYKAFRTTILKETPLRSNGFAFEDLKITIKLAKRAALAYTITDRLSPVITGGPMRKAKRSGNEMLSKLSWQSSAIHFPMICIKIPGRRRFTLFRRLRTLIGGWRTRLDLLSGSAYWRLAAASVI